MPPITTSRMPEWPTSSRATFNALVTTVIPRRSASTRASSRTVDPPVMPTTAPSGTRAAAARAIRLFSVCRSTALTRAGISSPDSLASAPPWVRISS